MHFHWAFRRGRNVRYAERSISQGFLERASLFCPCFCPCCARGACRKGLENLARLHVRDSRRKNSPLLQALIAANSAAARNGFALKKGPAPPCTFGAKGLYRRHSRTSEMTFGG